MCTTGAKIIHSGQEFVLFKNRDFNRDQFNDRVHLSESEFGVLGLETWDGDGQSEDRFSGFSIGFNKDLACCDSNVRSIPGAKNYDRLVQAVVEQCHTIDEAVECVREMVRQATFSWSNMIIATAHEVAALEVREHHVEVQSQSACIARANHHVVLGAHPDNDDTTTTMWRYETADAQLAQVNGIDDVFDLLRLKHAEEEYGICNSGQYNTVYSYVVHWVDGDINFYVLQGRPTSTRAYTKIPVELGGTVDLSMYPSDHRANSIPG